MPIYGYQCQACHHEFELMQKMSDPVPTVCPVCNKPELRKQLSAAGFQLKGSGWYATDFKGSAKPKPEANAGTESKAGAESKSGTGSKAGSDSGSKSGNGAS